MSRFAEFNNHANSPVAVYQDKLYNLPFSMNKFLKLWGIRTAQETHEIIECQKVAEAVEEPRNLEEQTLSRVGCDV